MIWLLLEDVHSEKNHDRERKGNHSSLVVNKKVLRMADLFDIEEPFKVLKK